MVICHLFACAYWYLHTYQINNDLEGITWINYHEIQNPEMQKLDEWQRIYLYSFYFACTTMSTVGFGDVIPSTNYEIALTIFSMLFSSAIFGYVITHIGDIILDMNQEKEVYKKEIHLTSRYLEKMSVSQQLKTEVINYISYKFKTDKEISLEDQKYIVEKIPQSLKDKIKLESNMTIVKKNLLFTKFTLKTKEKIAMKLEEINLQENQTLFRRGDFEENNNYYIIVNGSIQIEQNKSIILTEGHSLGEYSFLTGNERYFTAKTTQRSIVLTISRNDFTEIVQQVQQDYEIFCLMKDKFNFRDNIQTRNMITSEKCHVCNSDQHIFQECHYIHFIPDKTKIILTENFTRNQLRNEHSTGLPQYLKQKTHDKSINSKQPLQQNQYPIFKRQKIEKFQNLKDNQKIKLVALEIFEDLFQTEEDEDDYYDDEIEHFNFKDYDENGCLISSNNTTSNYLKAKDLKDMINEYKIEKIVENSVYENDEEDEDNQNQNGQDIFVDDKSYEFMNQTKPMNTRQIYRDLQNPKQMRQENKRKSYLSRQESSNNIGSKKQLTLLEKSPKIIKLSGLQQQMQKKRQSTQNLYLPSSPLMMEVQRQQNEQYYDDNYQYQNQYNLSPNNFAGQYNNQLNNKQQNNLMRRGTKILTFNNSKPFANKLMLRENNESIIPIQLYKEQNGNEQIQLAVINDKIQDWQHYYPKFNFFKKITQVLNFQEIYEQRPNFHEYFAKYTFYNYKKAKKKKYNKKDGQKQKTPLKTTSRYGKQDYSYIGENSKRYQL